MPEQPGSRSDGDGQDPHPSRATGPLPCRRRRCPGWRGVAWHRRSSGRCTLANLGNTSGHQRTRCRRRRSTKRWASGYHTSSSARGSDPAALDQPCQFTSGPPAAALANEHEAGASAAAQLAQQPSLQSYTIGARRSPLCPCAYSCRPPPGARSHPPAWGSRAVASLMAVIDHSSALASACGLPICSRFQAARQRTQQNLACSRRGTNEARRQPQTTARKSRRSKARRL